MTTKILILFFLLSFGIAKSQFVSTIFIDTLEITVNDKKIYSSVERTLKFIPDTGDLKLPIYKDDVYALVLKFAVNKSYGYPKSHGAGIEFVSRNTAYPLRILTAKGPDYEDCSELDMATYTLQNWIENTPIPAEKIQVKLRYALFGFAPKDTTNYALNYREGLWIGYQPHTKEISLHYKNDKKNGVAKARYDNNVTYEVNYKNNIADNYGQGLWNVDGEYTGFRFSYVIPDVITRSCDSVKNRRHESFYLKRGKKLKYFSSADEFSVYSIKKGIHTDSVEFQSKGEFVVIVDDTLALNADGFSEHNFYKKYTDSTHYLWTDFTYTKPVKIPLHQITTIYKSREELKRITGTATALSIVTALVVSPLVSIQKKGFNTERFKRVSGVSAGVMAVSITVGVTFGQRKFLIKPTQKRKKVWEIKAD